MEEKQTLFSIELAVDSFRLVPHTVICRLPAVAFRLLDFPPLSIQQLDLEETKQLKRAERGMWEDDRKIPNQINELKNQRGDYEFTKAKSSLFNYDLDVLQTHLENTPLYVMILDVWNEEAPKLVCHCNISLKEVVGAVKRDVTVYGISIPSVHGRQGKFPLFNLMGSEIGWISLGIRLLSLGGNLTPHIPVAVPFSGMGGHLEGVVVNEPNLVMGQKSSERIPTVEPKISNPIVTKLESNGSHSALEVNREIHNNVRHQKKKAVSVATETDFQYHNDQTKESSVKSEGYSRQRRVDSYDYIENHEIGKDLFVTNVHIPPPLFFNAENEPGDEPHKVIHSLSRFEMECQRNAPNISFDSVSEERKELEVQYTIYPPQIHSSPNVRKILRKKKQDGTRITKVRIESDDEITNKENKVTDIKYGPSEREMPADAIYLEHIQRLPILNALLQELSLLHGRNVHDKAVLSKVPPAQHYHKMHQDEPPIKDRTREKNEEYHNLGQKRDACKTEQITENKPPRQKAYRHKHKDCTQPPRGVPATKGWLRQEPVYGKSRKNKKTKEVKELKFKMTHSQKLRLQRHNPEAFRQMEEEERIAEIQFQMQVAQMEAKKDSGRKPNVSVKKVSPALSTSENVINVPRSPISTQIARQLSVEDQEDLVRESDFKPGTETFKINRDEYEQDLPMVQDQVDGKDQFQMTHGALSNDVSEQDLSGSCNKSIRSIRIHLPTASVPDDKKNLQEGDHDIEDQSSSEESQDEGPKVVSAPGFPEDNHSGGEMGDIDHGASPHAVPSSQGIYSEDFDDSYNFESTGEQELASIKSSDYTPRFSEEPITSARDHTSTAERSDHSRASGQSDESSYETVESVKSAGSRKADSVHSDSGARTESIMYPDGAKTKGRDGPKTKVIVVEQQKSSSDSSSTTTTSSKHPTAVLAIPQPQMSANSPVPLARKSTSKAVSFKPTTPQDTPQPKPRLSLDQTGSSVSDASLLAPDLTLSKESLDIDTSELKPDLGDGDDSVSDLYSDDFESGDD